MCIIRVLQCSTKGRKVGTLVLKLFPICAVLVLCRQHVQVRCRSCTRFATNASPTTFTTQGANCLGWKCCKPRVLTFEEFLAIPPCTTGKHSTVDDTPVPEPAKVPEDLPASDPVPAKTLPERQPISSPTVAPTPSTIPALEESDSDDPSLEIPANATCRRKGCGATYTGSTARDDEKCVHHPGAPIFHEGSKGWSCCKRRVLEFDQFLKIPGCTEKTRHMFVGKAKASGEEKVESVR